MKLLVDTFLPDAAPNFVTKTIQNNRTRNVICIASMILYPLQDTSDWQISNMIHCYSFSSTKLQIQRDADKVAKQLQVQRFNSGQSSAIYERT
jgi:hypothetical protein